jgi:hypothetical protein
MPYASRVHVPCSPEPLEAASVDRPLTLSKALQDSLELDLIDLRRLEAILRQL